MRLATMMGLMLEEMGEHIVAPLHLDAARAMDVHRAVELFIVQGQTKSDKAAVSCQLRCAKVAPVRKWDLIGPGLRAKGTTFEGV